MTPIHNPELGGGGAGLLVRRDAACAEIWYPAAPPATVTSGAGAWVWGAPVVLGSPGQDFILSYLHVVNYSSAAALIDSTVELYHGPDTADRLDAARELAPFYNPGPTSAWALPLSQMARWPVSPQYENIRARAATDSLVAYDFEVMILGWLGSLPPFATLTPAASLYGRWYPANSGAAYIASTAGAGWAFGASTTVLASATNDMLVVGLESLNSLAHLLDPMTLWQIGYGPNLSETWCATVSMGRTWNTRWIWPPIHVQAGERLAVRSADTVAGIRGCRVKAYLI